METPKPSLEKLRANKKLFHLGAVFQDARHNRVHLTVDEAEVATLIERAEIRKPAAGRLLEDTLLIAGWYYLPQRRARLRLDEASHIEDLARASKHASRLVYSLADANNIEESIRSLA